MFTKLDANNDGSLVGVEAAKVEEAMTKSSVKAKDAGTVTKDEFLEQCMKDIFVWHGSIAFEDLEWTDGFIRSVRLFFGGGY